MKSRVLILAALVLLTAIPVWWWARGSPAKLETAPFALATTSAANVGVAEHSPGGPAGSSPEKTVASSEVDYAAQFRDSTNYFDFVQKTRPAAMAGDPRAQVYLYRALRSCSTDYQLLFKSQRQNRYLSYEEGLQEATKRLPFRPEYARVVHARCHGLFDPLDPDVERPEEWLRRAALGMDPLALAMATGRALVTPGTMQPDNTDPVQEEERIALIRRQLGTAIRSRDPDAILEIAKVIHLYGPPDANPDTLSEEWLMTACHRGVDCTSSGEVAIGLCLWDPECQPYESVADVIQRRVGAGFPAIEQRAREINALIDAGAWEELGFGETLTDS